MKLDNTIRIILALSVVAGLVMIWVAPGERNAASNSFSRTERAEIERMRAAQRERMKEQAEKEKASK